MAPDHTRQSGSDQPSSDPWQAFSYLVAGVLLYGGLGWLADWYWGTSFLVLIGILLGAGLGMFMVFKTFAMKPEQGDDDQGSEK